MSRDTTPPSYDKLFQGVFDSIPDANLPKFARLAPAINMAASAIPRESSDRASAIDAIDLAASQILADSLSEIANAKDLEDAFKVLNDNPQCVQVLLGSPHLTQAVIQSAMESAAASTSPRSIQSFQLLLSRSRSPNYQKILEEALKMHRRRNSVPFIRCVLQHMWGQRPLPFTDQGVVRFVQAITAKTPEERAKAFIEVFDDLRTYADGKHDTSENREALANLILSSIKPDKQPWHTRFTAWLSKTFGKIFGRKKSTATPNLTALIKQIQAEVGPETAKKLDAVVTGKVPSRSEHVPVKPTGKSVRTVPPHTPTSDMGHAARPRSSHEAGSKGVQP